MSILYLQRYLWEVIEANPKEENSDLVETSHFKLIFFNAFYLYQDVYA